MFRHFIGISTLSQVFKSGRNLFKEQLVFCAHSIELLSEYGYQDSVKFCKDFVENYISKCNFYNTVHNLTDSRRTLESTSNCLSTVSS